MRPPAKRGQGGENPIQAALGAVARATSSASGSLFGQNHADHYAEPGLSVAASRPAAPDVVDALRKPNAFAARKVDTRMIGV